MEFVLFLVFRVVMWVLRPLLFQLARKSGLLRMFTSHTLSGLVLSNAHRRAGRRHRLRVSIFKTKQVLIYYRTEPVIFASFKRVPTKFAPIKLASLKSVPFKLTFFSCTSFILALTKVVIGIIFLSAGCPKS